MAAPARIAIMGHVGNGNLGDEAIIAAVIARLRARAPDVDLVAFSSNPPDTAARHGLTTFPIRLMAERRGPESEAAEPPGPASGVAERIRRRPWLKALLRPAVVTARRIASLVRETLFDLRSLRRLRGVRLIVFAGSGQLNDDIDGAFGYPLVILRWTVLARLRGAAVAFASIGAGPLEYRLSRLFLKLALRLTAYRSFRDPSSLAIARRLRAPEPCRLVRDLALSHPRFGPEGPPAHPDRAPCVGINPLPFLGGGSWQMQDRSRYDGYVAAHAELARGLAAKGWRVVLFPTQIRMDPETIEDIVGRLAAGGAPEASRVESATGIADVADLFDVLEQFDLVVATRYHGVLLALASGIPTVAVSYHPKTRDIMEHMGLAPWCLGLEGLSGSVLLERTADMASRLGEVRATLARQRGRDLADLLRQYDELLRVSGTAVARGPAAPPARS